MFKEYIPKKTSVFSHRLLTMCRITLITLFACGWASLATTEYACKMSNIDFCTCKEYDVRFSNETWDTSPDANPLEAVAPTTIPRTRDPYKQIIINCNLVNCTNYYSSSLEKLASSLYRKWVDKLFIERVPLEKEMVVARFPNLWLKDVRIKQFEVGHSKLAGDFIWKGNPFAGQNHTLIWFAAINCSLAGSLTYDTLGTANTRVGTGFKFCEKTYFRTCPPSVCWTSATISCFPCRKSLGILFGGNYR
ncbi:unnamed protein product [Larinioides sclopetarius]|uniref:Uncharacterized protein n=1 Tax=Larinioides sclopetarius TaxID=280406 RepID=A0AAV1ZPX4_9ARAC